MSDGKLPAFQFYPGDWRNDPGLRACSAQARGIWIDMMCIMHTCTPYGHLSIGGKPMSNSQIARMIGESKFKITSAITELEMNKVFSRSKDGTIYSRRMVKDAYLRTIRAEAGSRGGVSTQANLLKQTLKQNDQQKTPPSSSSSSAVKEPPLPPASGGSMASAKTAIETTAHPPPRINPRARGDNPRAVAKKINAEAVRAETIKPWDYEATTPSEKVYNPARDGSMVEKLKASLAGSHAR